VLGNLSSALHGFILAKNSFCVIYDIFISNFYEVKAIMSKIGYIRVSSIEQNTDRQEIALSEIGMDRIFIEKISGKTTYRPELKKMLEYIREGDIYGGQSCQDIFLPLYKVDPESSFPQ